MSMNLLVVKCAEDIEKWEIGMVKSLAQMHSIKVTIVDRAKGERIDEKTACKCFDMICLCGHGNIEEFGGEACQTWDDV